MKTDDTEALGRQARSKPNTTNQPHRLYNVHHNICAVHSNVQKKLTSKKK